MRHQRVVSGEQVWRSEKVKAVDEKFRAHYTWVLPLARKDEWFRCSPRYILYNCYVYVMPHITEEFVVEMLDSFESAGLLERNNNGQGRWLPLDTEPSALRKKLVEEQDGKCAVCETTTPRHKGWCLDHNHDTLRVRGVLCGTCNRTLGMLKDSSAILRKAAEYLDKEFEVAHGPLWSE